MRLRLDVSRLVPGGGDALRPDLPRRDPRDRDRRHERVRARRDRHRDQRRHRPRAHRRDRRRRELRLLRAPARRLQRDREPHRLRQRRPPGASGSRPPASAAWTSCSRPEAGPRASTWWPAAPLVDSSDNTQGGTISGAQAAELPVNGRDFTKLLSMVPGTRRRPELDQRLARLLRPLQRQRQPRPLQQLPAGRHRHERRLPQPARDQPGRRLRHARPRSCRWTRSQEFPILSGAEAEYGRNAGAIVNIVTKSGTNELPRRRLRVLPRRVARRAELLQHRAPAQEPVQQPPVRRPRSAGRS